MYALFTIGKISKTMALSLFGFARWSKLLGTKDDDWADRVSHLWTVGLLTFCALFVSTTQFVGEPIQCWCPAQFTGSYVSYTKNICWVSNTYYIPMDESIPINIKERHNKEINYYQWVPIILIFQALLFKVPNLIWKMSNTSCGLNIDKIVSSAESTQFEKPEHREQSIYPVAKYIDRWLQARRQYKYNLLSRLRRRFANIFCFWLAKRDGKYLTGLYMSIKLLFVANAAIQFFFLNLFLSMDYSAYGLEVIQSLITTGEFKESPRFPRVTLCDFEIRQLQNIQRYTVQCVLPINLFNEKIFIVLWFWYLLVAVISAFNYLCWLYHVLRRGNRYAFVKKFLKLGGDLRSTSERKLAIQFANEYLRDDGVFVLKMVAENSSELVLNDLVNHLWVLFKDNPHMTITYENRLRDAKLNGSHEKISPDNNHKL
jgi:hypothetical protein